MDRRSFLRAASAAGLAPLMPAFTVSAAPAAAAPVVNEFMYGLAAFNARVRGASSVAKIARDLGIAKEAAVSIQSKLIADGLVAAPNAAGLSRACDPIVRSDLGWRRKLKDAALEKAEELARQAFEAEEDLEHNPSFEQSSPVDADRVESTSK